MIVDPQAYMFPEMEVAFPPDRSPHDWVVWADINVPPDYDFPGYECSTLGQFRNKKTRRLLFGTPARGGYYQNIGLVKEGKQLWRQAHIVIATVFLPKPISLKRLEVGHLNGIGTDNRVVNLCWCTRKENSLHGWVLRGIRLRQEAVAALALA
jgi:hypothetical protein